MPDIPAYPENRKDVYSPVGEMVLGSLGELISCKVCSLSGQALVEGIIEPAPPLLPFQGNTYLGGKLLPRFSQTLKPHACMCAYGHH